MTRRPHISPQSRAVLALLSDAPHEWRYGYEICKRTGLKSGTLYPILKRLHAQGYLEADWHPPTEPGRPPRHAYRLTQAGVSLARERAAMQATAAHQPRERLA